MLTEEQKAKLLEDGKTEIEITYLEKIEELKDKMDAMVDPEEHAKLKTEHDKLLNDYINKRPAPKKDEPTYRDPGVIANELRKINDGDMTNREYIEKSLEYRKSYMAKFGTDPFTDFGISGSDKETPKTKYIADSLQQLLDENPTPVGFNMALQSVMKDDKNVIAILRERAKNKK